MKKYQTKAKSSYYVNYGLSIIASNTGVSVVFKTKRELKCPNELFLKFHFSGNTILYVFTTEII